MKITIENVSTVINHDVIAGETDNMAFHGTLYSDEYEADVIHVHSVGDIKISLFEVIKGDFSKVKVGDVLTDKKS